MRINDLRYFVENFGYYLVEDDLGWPFNVTWPWQIAPDLFPPPAGAWPPVPGEPTYIPNPPDWYPGTAQEWRDYYKQITTQYPYVPEGFGIPWDPNPWGEHGNGTDFFGQYPPKTPELAPDNPLGIRPENPDNPLTVPELLDPLGNNPLDPDFDPNGEVNPFRGPYEHRGWHYVNGEWVWNPNMPGGYSEYEKRWFRSNPFEDPAMHPPGSMPVQPQVPHGPGIWGEGGTWIPYVENPPGHFSPDFNGDGIPDGPPIIRPTINPADLSNNPLDGGLPGNGGNGGGRPIRTIDTPGGNNPGNSPKPVRPVRFNPPGPL